MDGKVEVRIGRIGAEMQVVRKYLKSSHVLDSFEEASTHQMIRTRCKVLPRLCNRNGGLAEC